MLVTKALVTYKCINCNIPYVFNFTPGGNVTEVADNLDKYKQCSVCARKLQLVRAIFKVMEDEYGDIGFGLWRCPSHPAFTYYPAQLKKAVNNDIQAITVGSDIHYVRYLNVAAAKHPWKCPICGQQLIYIDERYKYAY